MWSLFRSLTHFTFFDSLIIDGFCKDKGLSCIVRLFIDLSSMDRIFVQRVDPDE